MKNRSLLIGVLMGLALLAAVVFMTVSDWRNSASHGAAYSSPSFSSSPSPERMASLPGRSPATSSSPTGAPGAPSAFPSTPPAAGSMAPPMATSSLPSPSPTTGAGAVATSPAAPGSTSPTPLGQKPGIAEIQQRLAALSAKGANTDPLEVDKVLADLQRVQGGNDLNGIDLSAMRENLQRAAEMQRLAKEMEKIAQNPTKEDMPRLQALMAQIQKQQSGLHTDLTLKQAPPKK